MNSILLLIKFSSAFEVLMNNFFQNDEEVAFCSLLCYFNFAANAKVALSNDDLTVRTGFIVIVFSAYKIFFVIFSSVLF